MSKKDNKKSILPFWTQCIMPFLITIFCGAIIFLLSIRPYEKFQTYINIAFMDENMIVPKSDGIAGLTIVETDIDTEYNGMITSDGEPKYPEYGTQYAVLECETLDMFVPVYWGTGSELLEKGACNTPASVPAGGEGNTVISAHVNTFFSNLKSIKEGDKVILYTDYGRFTYSVSKLIEFKSTDESYIKKTKDDVLTLYTCDMDLMASSSKRIGAVCKLEKREYYVSGGAQNE